MRLDALVTQDAVITITVVAVVITTVEIVATTIVDVIVTPMTLPMRNVI